MTVELVIYRKQEISIKNVFACSVVSDSLQPHGLQPARQEYWGGVPCPPPGYLPNPGTKPVSLVSPALAGRFFFH